MSGRGGFVLPVQVVGPADVQRLLRELETLDDALRQAALRKAGSATHLPKTSGALEVLASSNMRNLLLPSDRQQLAHALQVLLEQAPAIHMSFASEPSAEFTGKIVAWLRENIHPLLLVNLGLQPTIAAGCTVRTTNKYFDFSLRQHLVRNRHLLTDSLLQLGQQIAPVAVPAVPVSVASQVPAAPTGGPQ